MAEPWARHSPCRNFQSTGEDELAEATPGAPIDDNGTHCYTPVVSCVPSPTPAPAVNPAPTEAAAKYTDKNLQRTIQLALNSFVQGQQQA